MDAFLQIIYVLGIIFLAIVYVASVTWAARDAEYRGKSGCLVAPLVILLPWPIGLIAWIVFRPEFRKPNDTAGPAP